MQYTSMEVQFGRIFREISHKLNEGTDPERLLDFLFESLGMIIPYDRIGIALIEGIGDAQKLCSRWMKSKLPASNIVAGYSAPLNGSSLLKILETGQPRIINDLLLYGHEHPHSESTKLILKDGIRSSLTCPLLADGKYVGIVFFSSASPNAYRDEHVQTYLEIADELSLIIEHERLCRRDSSRTQNLRMVLHDLKNPLSVIQGFLEMSHEMDWYEKLDADAKEVFSILQRNTAYMHELLSEISELGRLETQGEKIEIRETTMREFLAEFAMRSRELAEKKEIGFTVEIEPGVPEKMKMDALKIRRVLDNLVSNAVKYSLRGTKIQVSIVPEKHRLVFEVRDQGPGIPESELPKLFQEFSRTSVRPTEGEQSTGLGLAIVKKIVEQHGGQISVKSQVGQGSSFSFWLPCEETETVH